MASGLHRNSSLPEQSWPGTQRVPGPSPGTWLPEWLPSRSNVPDICDWESCWWWRATRNLSRLRIAHIHIVQLQDSLYQFLRKGGCWIELALSVGHYCGVCIGLYVRHRCSHLVMWRLRSSRPHCSCCCHSVSQQLWKVLIIKRQRTRIQSSRMPVRSPGKFK